MPISQPSQFNQKANVYVKNIDPAVTPKEFEVFFEEYGEIITTNLRTNDEGESLCYGYV